jgi:hypothetical protein
MAYVELFASAAKHVKSKGINPTVQRGKQLTLKAMERAWVKSPLPVPQS